MLIIQNKCDQNDQEERRFPIPEQALNALQYVKELHFSPKTDDTTTEYIAPDLLPTRASIADRLVSRWTEHRPGETATFRYPLLYGGLIRSIMAEIGQLAGIDGLYWRGGLCTFDADTRSRLLIEEEMTETWQGVIHLRIQDGKAATLLQKAIDLIERIQTRLSVQPLTMERSSPAQDLLPSATISPAPAPKDSKNPAGTSPTPGATTAPQRAKIARTSSTNSAKPPTPKATASYATRKC